jgi:hypothetical protein
VLKEIHFSELLKQRNEIRVGRIDWSRRWRRKNEEEVALEEGCLVK